MTSRVEQLALERSGQRLKYEPDEKIGVIVVDHFPALGTLTALRFLEWVQANPGGVVSLPTGKTPEYFIKEVQRFLRGWDQKSIQQELESYGIDPAIKPDLQSLHFVQIDEFYPIDPAQHNSFYNYVQKFYIQGFQFDPARALLINCHEIGLPPGKSLEQVWPDGHVDLSLRYRKPVTRLEQIQKEVLERIDTWCIEYEERIRALGGIGFFLGGIGPDGHIGFNISGSDFFSTTRLTQTNYETQAAAAGDLGGIEISRNRLVITIGLSTITYNPDCVAVIIAAGEAKAEIVAQSVRQPMNIRYPATVLQKLPHARFFLTRGAAKLLRERQAQLLANQPDFTEEQIEKILVDMSLAFRKRIRDLQQSDFEQDRFGRLLLEVGLPVNETTANTEARLRRKIDAGIELETGRRFLHTEPHHDDIMLGYLPYVVRHIREHSNQHFFVTLTSGFTAVTNSFMIRRLENLLGMMNGKHNGAFIEFLDTLEKAPDLEFEKDVDVWIYLDGVASYSEEKKIEGYSRRLARNIMQLYQINNRTALEKKIRELITYFQNQYPGQKDAPDKQQLKGMCREWEGDCLWGYFGWHSDSIDHLRLGFYKGDIFNEEPTMERDVQPVLELFRRVRPDIVTVALDPEASGPDTHYKVLQAINEALKLYRQETHPTPDITVIGYRNVWYRFHPSEADIFVPVSLNMFALQDNSFKNSFLSQKDASFPSYEYDGPFSELAQRIQVEQYEKLKICLGSEYFNHHQSALIRATRGMVFLKKLTPDEFHRFSRELRKSTENR